MSCLACNLLVFIEIVFHQKKEKKKKKRVKVIEIVRLHLATTKNKVKERKRVTERE